MPNNPGNVSETEQYWSWWQSKNNDDKWCCNTGQEAAPMSIQHAKKVVSNSPGLVDFAIGLVNSVFNLSDGQVMFFEELE